MGARADWQNFLTLHKKTYRKCKGKEAFIYVPSSLLCLPR